MRHPVLRLVSTAIVLALTLMFSATAKQISIRIDRVAGTVEVRHELETGGAWQPAERFADLGPGWQLRTGADSKAMLVFPFGNVCILKAGSVLTVDKLGLKEGSKLKLDAGGLVADIRSALSPGSEFSVETSGALAVVRGTNFAVDYRVNDAGEEIVWFCCYRGEVELSNDYGPSQLLDEGTFVTVKPGTPITVPVPSTPKAADFMLGIIDLAPFETAETEEADDVEPGEVAMQLQLNGVSVVAKVLVFDSQGSLVAQGESDRYGIVYVSPLAAGTYTIKFSKENDEPYAAVRGVSVQAGAAAFRQVELAEAADQQDATR